MQVLASEGEDVGCEEERVAASVKAGEERETRGRVQDTPQVQFMFSTLHQSTSPLRKAFALSRDGIVH